MFVSITSLASSLLTFFEASTHLSSAAAVCRISSIVFKCVQTDHSEREEKYIKVAQSSSAIDDNLLILSISSVYDAPCVAAEEILKHFVNVIPLTFRNISMGFLRRGAIDINQSNIHNTLHNHISTGFKFVINC